MKQTNSNNVEMCIDITHEEFNQKIKWHSKIPIQLEIDFQKVKSKFKLEKFTTK